MADIEALIKKYFVQPEDVVLPSQPMPATYSGNKITPLIDGTTYFADLKAKIDALGFGSSTEIDKQFIYIAGWQLHLVGGKINPSPGSVGTSTGPSTGLADPFSLDGPSLTPTLIKLLKDKAKVGVDVRVLGWAGFALEADYFVLTSAVDNGLGWVRDINAATIASVRELRNEPTLVGKAWLNILAHSSGASHTKLAIVGDGATAVGYTGGLDLVGDRHGSRPHPPKEWHDVQARVEGPAVQAMYDYFRDLWNEIRGRDVKTFRIGSTDVHSHTPGYPAVPTRPLPTTAVGKHRVQSLRTVPQFNYAATNLLPENEKISFAPSGLFEIRSAWFNAILAAERYIYIEDQAFWSIELMTKLNKAVKDHPDLKVLMVAGRVDPTDPRYPPFGLVALYDGLLKDLNPVQRDQVRMFKRDVIVHTKSTIIDDHWALIGSANVSRRSLYTDLEHSVAFLDEDDVAVRDYRVQLWSDSLRLLTTAEQQKILDVGKALDVWWRKPGSVVTVPSSVTEVELPTSPTVLADSEKDKYDRYADVDSTKPWGGCWP